MKVKSNKIILLAALCLTGSPAFALNLSSSPLFLGAFVDPNVMFLLDDSGSMDWEIMSKDHWTKCSYDPLATGSFRSNNCGFLVVDGSMYTGDTEGYSNLIVNLFSNSDNIYGNCAGWYSWNLECESRDDWRGYSSDVNTLAYNPDSTYLPWKGPCLDNGTFCSDATFSSAKSNPREGQNGYTVIRDLSSTYYQVWIDDAGFSGSRPGRGTNYDYEAIPNELVDFWDTHIRIRFDSASSATVDKITYAPDVTGINASVSTLATLTSPGVCYNALGTQSLVRQINSGTLSASSVGADRCRTLTDASQNYANWYQYDRKRSFASKSAIAVVMQQSPNMRYGNTVTKNHNDLFTEVPASGVNYYVPHNNALLSDLFAYPWQKESTPLRRGLERVGRYYDHDLNDHTDPIISACQQNFTIMLTDGYWNGDAPLGSIGDTDGDGYSPTVADVAQHYYETDLNPYADIVPGNARDPLHIQHMVTFTVAFGLAGNLSDTDDDGWPNPVLTESSNWGNPFYDEAAKVDDIWHAAYNARGTFVSAQTPDEIGDQLSSALNDIHTRISSAASVAQNTSILNGESRVYQTQFNSAEWKGHLLAFPITVAGVTATASWDAGCRLTGGPCLTALSPSDGIVANDRVVLSYNRDEKRGIPFRFPSDYTSPSSSEMSAAQVTAILTGLSADQQTEGTKRVNYLRGDTDFEQQNGGNFRNRTSLLGDFIHASPAYVGPPRRFYPDNLEPAAYSSFKSTYSSRDTLIYVGANDGMLHGFDVSTGDEKIAYVPSDRTMFDNLYQLTDPNYSHRYYVDGSAKVNDAFVNNAWKSVLVGSLRAGGQGIYALDITDPGSFSEANSASLVLWEFTDDDDARMGYSFSEPQIGRLANGEWAVIIGNGYNSAQVDDAAASDSQASLIILLIDGGLDGTWTKNTDYFVLPVGPTGVDSGLATPALVDIDQNYNIDYVYAGDLQGNLWRFDLRSSTPGDWNSSLLFNAGTTQPITAAPVIGRHQSEDGVMVYVGTGKYLEAADNTNTGQDTQSFYGIHDKLDGSVVLVSELLDQNITGTQTINGLNLRNSTDNPLDWALYNGWKMDLIDTSLGDNQGERVVSQAILRSGRIIFTTIIASSNTCEAGGTSWIMELDANDGSRLGQAPFDLNGDNTFNNDDLINMGDLDGDEEGDLIAPSGLQSNVGISSKPTILLTPERDREIKVISGSTGLGTFSENPVSHTLGRQNWKRLK